MNWTFWLGIVSPHLSELVRALASIPGQTVTVVADHEPADERKAIGWRVADCSPASVLIKPHPTVVEQLICQSDDRKSVHLLGGLPNITLNRQVLFRLARTKATVGLISESADNRGVLGFARQAKYRTDRYFVEPHLHFILAMGQLGVRWFESVGYNSLHIYPFMYVTERPLMGSRAASEAHASQGLRMLYLGQLIRRKDCLTLFRSLQDFAGHPWTLDIVGSGPELKRWQRASETIDLGARIRFSPAIDNRSIGFLLDHTDLLLLPSRWDGWGAVVNEALMCGVPVICSDNCGAADLLREPWRGQIFKAGSVESLRHVLRGWIERGKRSDDFSARIRQWSAVLEGQQAAHYLIDIVVYLHNGGIRPSPPWY